LPGDCNPVVDKTIIDIRWKKLRKYNMFLTLLYLSNLFLLLCLIYLPPDSNSYRLLAAIFIIFINIFLLIYEEKKMLSIKDIMDIRYLTWTLIDIRTFILSLSAGIYSIMGIYETALEYIYQISIL
jgi:hypothetical protein